MTSRIQCFWVEPTEECDVYLRIFSWGSDCPSEGRAPRDCPLRPAGRGHDAKTAVLWREAFPLRDEKYGRIDGSRMDDLDHADPRWPKCACGYEFTDGDVWQVVRDRLYKRGETGEIYTTDQAPVGAMWNAFWYLDSGWAQKQTDGIALMVKTPGGEWCVDCSDRNGGYWTRTGSIPNVTAQPSIQIGSKYHGWLKDGWLEEC